jgi:hypothetical protein
MFAIYDRRLYAPFSSDDGAGRSENGGFRKGPPYRT